MAVTAVMKVMAIVTVTVVGYAVGGCDSSGENNGNVTIIIVRITIVVDVVVVVMVIPVLILHGGGIVGGDGGSSGERKMALVTVNQGGIAVDAGDSRDEGNGGGNSNCRWYCCWWSW